MAVRAQASMRFYTYGSIHSHRVTSVAVSVWSTPGTVEQCRYALECAVNILGNLTKYFDIPYPLPKMDLVAIPECASLSTHTQIAQNTHNWRTHTHNKHTRTLN